MRNTGVVCCMILAVQISSAQSATDYYRQGDSLSRLKDYKNSAMAYTEGINIQANNAAMNRYRSASGAWAMANLPDSAFHFLDIMAKSDKVSKVNLQQVEFGLDYLALRTDKRWQHVLEKMRKQAEKNSYPQDELVYGRKDGVALSLVWVKPKIKSNGKAIMAISSGNWVSGFNGIELVPATAGVEQYLAKGFTVFGVMHGSQPRYTIPEQVEDLKRAVRYIRYNAPRFGIDADHIGITGSSSGGNLSLLVATADDKINTTANDPVDRVSSRVQAVAVLFPPTDMLNWSSYGNIVNAVQLQKASRVSGAFDFKVWNENSRTYDAVTDTSARNKIGKEISPIYAVSSDDPPVFIVHGDADATVPLQQSQTIIARYIEAGVPNNFVIKKGGRHNPDDMNPEWQQFVEWFDKYLK